MRLLRDCYYYYCYYYFLNFLIHAWNIIYVFSEGFYERVGRRICNLHIRGDARSHRPTKKEPFARYIQRAFKKKNRFTVCLLVPNVVEKKKCLLFENIEQFRVGGIQFRFVRVCVPPLLRSQSVWKRISRSTVRLNSTRNKKFKLGAVANVCASVWNPHFLSVLLRIVDRLRERVAKYVFPTMRSVWTAVYSDRTFYV